MEIEKNCGRETFCPFLFLEQRLGIFHNFYVTATMAGVTAYTSGSGTPTSLVGGDESSLPITISSETEPAENCSPIPAAKERSQPAEREHLSLRQMSSEQYRQADLFRYKN